MIIGNPYKFSIFTKIIKEWNDDDTFCNGVLIFCIDGGLFPEEVVTASLRGEIACIREKLEHLTIDNRLFHMSKNEAFVEIYNITYPEKWDRDNDYRFDISPMSLSDMHCYIFAVSDGEKVRVMGAKLDYIMAESRHKLMDIDIKEAVIAIEELNDIVVQLDVNNPNMLI